MENKIDSMAALHFFDTHYIPPDTSGEQLSYLLYVREELSARCVVSPKFSNSHFDSTTKLEMLMHSFFQFHNDLSSLR
jgi:hypothetical protein